MEVRQVAYYEPKGAVLGTLLLTLCWDGFWRDLACWERHPRLAMLPQFEGA